MATVSIIMAAYNAEPYIDAAIASVQKQTFADWELIVVNDGSRDRTGSIADRWSREDTRVRVIHQANSGRPGVARNAGLAVAQGAFIGFIDADDLYAPERLAVCVRAIQEHRDCGLVFHDFATIDDDGTVMRASVLAELGFLTSTRVRSKPLGGGTARLDVSLLAFLMTDYVACCTGAVLVRTDVLGEEGVRFREDVVIAEDLDLWLRVLKVVPAVFIDRSLYFYRKNHGSVTDRRVRLIEDTLNVVESHCATVPVEVCPDFRVLFSTRMKKLYGELGYLYLMERKGASARRWFFRGFVRYGGSVNAMGVLKSFLPWASLKSFLGRGALGDGRR